MTATELAQAGYGPLVSVVPPDATLSPTSSLKAHTLGKVPGIRKRDGTWVGYPWRERNVAPRLIDEWGANVGLRGEHFPALDIDVEDEQLSQFILQEAHRVLGPSPVRTSRGSRRLLVYRAQQPFGRLAATIRFRHGEHVVEALGAGSQYLVHGGHPSGATYAWRGGSLAGWDPGSLSEITLEQVQDFFQHLAKKLEGRATVRLSGSGKVAAEDAPDQDGLRAPNADALRELVQSIPNTAPDRADYIEMGCAIKAAWGDTTGGFGVWWDWCQRWEGGTNERATAEADWSRMHPPFRVGWSWLVEKAEEHGYLSAQDEFEADPSAAISADVELPAGLTVEGVLDYTDTWVVTQLAEWLSSRVRFVPETGHWHVWGGA